MVNLASGIDRGNAGVIGAVGEEDRFETQLLGGLTHTFEALGSPTGNGTLSDTFLTLYANDGTTILSSDDNSGAGLNSRLSFTPGATGTYFVGVSGFGSNTGSYLVRGYHNADGLASTATTRSVRIGARSNGTLSGSGDHDWFRVNLVRGRTYNFTMNDPADNLDTFLGLRSNTGAVLRSDDDSGPGLNSRIADFRATRTGAFFLDAGAFADAGVGNYVLSARLV